jgi:hypothetical protein
MTTPLPVLTLTEARAAGLVDVEGAAYDDALERAGLTARVMHPPASWSVPGKVSRFAPAWADELGQAAFRYIVRDDGWRSEVYRAALLAGKADPAIGRAVVSLLLLHQRGGGAYQAVSDVADLIGYKPDADPPATPG